MDMNISNGMKGTRIGSSGSQIVNEVIRSWAVVEASPLRM